MYQIEMEMLDYVRGTRSVKVLPKRYKTHANAVRSASRIHQVVKPDGKTATSEINCRILTL